MGESMRMIQIRRTWLDRLTRRWELRSADNTLYLTRWHLLKLFGFKLFLHRMDGPDIDRYPHDHPWPFAALVLRGGYREQLVWFNREGHRCEVQAVHITRWNHKPARGKYHRIIKLDRTPTWTLVFVGRRVGEKGEWGYLLDDNSWVHHSRMYDGS